MLLSLALLLPCYLPQAPSTGVESLWGDWNADGRRDLLLVESGRARLFEDTSQLGFREVTVEAGLDAWSGLTSVLWHDFDGDGAADLLLARADGRGALLAGRRDGGWEERASSAGLDLARPLTRATSVGDAGTELLLEGPDGLRLARFVTGLGWSEFELSGTPAPTRGSVGVDTAGPSESELDESVAAHAAGHAESAQSTATQPMQLASGPVTGIGSGSLIGTGRPKQLNQICARFLHDQATGVCLSASSLPTLGKLYPISVNWFISQTGNVGIGTTTPAAKLDVAGTVRGQQLVSTASFFTAPLVVSSSVKVANLNADRLDGLDSSVFSQLGSSIEGSEISLGTIGADRLENPLVAPGATLGIVHAIASGLGATGLRGEASGTGSVAVRAVATGTSGLTYGVRATNASTTGRAVSADSTATTGLATGLYASTSSTSGSAIQAIASATTGYTFGVQATTAATAGAAVQAVATTTTGSAFGVQASTAATSGAAVQAYASATTGNTNGVQASTAATSGFGVYGLATRTGPYVASGVVGETNSSDGFGVLSIGAFTATGTKSFVQPHPTDASKQVRFVCLEGNESGTYFRGTTELSGGVAVIEVPEEFRLVSETEGLTVQLTPRGPGSLWLESVDLDRIIVRGDALTCDYFVNGVRRGFADVELMQTNRLWVPRYRGVPFGTQYPEALRRILVENGTLNADFTPNEATALERGWTLRDPEPSDLLSKAGGALEDSAEPLSAVGPK